MNRTIAQEWHKQCHGTQRPEGGKHVLLEKPFTTGVDTTSELLELTKNYGFAVHEGRAFTSHAKVE